MSELRVIQPGLWVDLGNGLEVRFDEPRARTVELYPGNRVAVDGPCQIRPKMADRQPIVRRTDPFGPAAMPALTTRYGPVFEAEFPGSICAVCDDEIEVGDRCRMGPAGIEHRECVDA